MFTCRSDPRKTASSRAPGAHDRQVRPSLTKSVVADETQVAFPRGAPHGQGKTPDSPATCEKASPGCPQALLGRCWHATAVADFSILAELCEPRQGAETPAMVTRRCLEGRFGSNGHQSTGFLRLDPAGRALPPARGAVVLQRPPAPGPQGHRDGHRPLR